MNEQKNSIDNMIEVEKVKIYVSYHKKCETVASEIMIPIQVGAAKNAVKLDMIRDNSGDNISDKNDKFCELTAQYWAWKNSEDADYYGFMHYRRHFIFGDISENPGLGGVVTFPSIDEQYKQYIGLQDNEIYECIKDYDVILPFPVDSSIWGTLSNEVQFSCLDNLHAIDFNIVCDTVKKLYPEYSDAVEEFRNGKYAYWYNMFIMRKEIFRDYSEWLFNVLLEAENCVDFTFFSEQEMRTLAFMAERLLSIYMIKLLHDQPDLKIKHLKISFINNVEAADEIKPAFEKNNVAIAVSCNEYYMPLLGVMLNSLLKNGSEDNNYDIIVVRNLNDFESETSKRYVKMLNKDIGNRKNASIRFVDISRLIGNKEFFVRGNFTPETYFRLFLPEIMVNYDKVLYLDADMVVKHDVAELYNYDIGDNLLGAVRDPIISGSNKAYLYNKHDYMEQLGIENIYDYFQAGVLLINLNEISKDKLCERMIEYAASHDCDLVDQDVLNLFCQGRVKYIDNKWNVDVNTIANSVVPFAPVKMWKEYQYNRDNAYIYHFAGADKPWCNPNLDKADIFWNAARETEWYEIILQDMLKASTFYKRGTSNNNINQILRGLSVFPDSIAHLVIPIVNAYAELDSIGIAGVIADSLVSEKYDYSGRVKDKRVIFYGAGNCCKQILLYFDQLGIEYPCEIWDMAAADGQRLFGVPVKKPEFASLNGVKDAISIITIESKTITEKVKKSFEENGFSNIICHEEIMRYVSTSLWLKLNAESEKNAKKD